MIRFFQILLPLFLTASVLLAAEPGVLGHVGEKEITKDEVTAALAGLDARQLNAVREDPALLEQVVRSFVVQRLVLREALDQGWDQRADVIAKVTRTRDSTLTESYLESVAQPAADYPNEQELLAAYDQRRTSLLVPRSYRLAQIFIAQDKAADESQRKAAEKKLRSLQRDLKAGADFAEKARTVSEESISASREGEIGWLTEEQIQPEIRLKLPNLKLFSVSEPIQLDDGWHILKVLDIREPFTPPLLQVRAQLRLTLRNERLRENTQAYLAKLLREKPLSLDSEALTQALPKSQE